MKKWIRDVNELVEKLSYVKEKEKENLEILKNRLREIDDEKRKEKE